MRTQCIYINTGLRVFCVSGNKASGIDTYIEFIIFYVADVLNMIVYDPHTEF